MSDDWAPRTGLGKLVKDGKIKSIDEVLDKGLKIREVGIVDALIPDIESDLFLIGQAKGKFGGGQRRAFRQTQKKTEDGTRITFRAMAVVGNKKGIIGIGSGRSAETVPSREKAFRDAKRNLISIKTGCGSWECGCGGNHSIPFSVDGKCGSVRLRLRPAPKGVGLCIHEECQKILRLAGIKDIWSWSKGTTTTNYNLVFALMDALKKLTTYKVIRK